MTGGTVAVGRMWGQQRPVRQGCRDGSLDHGSSGKALRHRFRPLEVAVHFEKASSDYRKAATAAYPTWTLLPAMAAGGNVSG